MDIVLHLGAHRSGSTTFQEYLRRNRGAMVDAGIATLLPGTLRGPAYRGLLQPDGLAALGTTVAQLRAVGASTLLISEENLGGSLQSHLRGAGIYPGMAGRLARLSQALGGGPRRIGIGVRPLAAWWGSVLAFAVGQGLHVPDGSEAARCIVTRCDWADVIADVAHAFPAADIVVWQSDELAGYPRLLARALAARDDLPPVGRVLRNNAAPDAADLRRRLIAAGQGDAARHLPATGRWQPFDRDQLRRLALRDAATLDRISGMAGIRLLAAPAFTRHTAPGLPRPPHPPEGGARDGRFGQMA